MPLPANAGPTLEERYFPVSPLMLFPGRRGDFNVYLQQDGEFVLYAKSGERFDEVHRRRLKENGVPEVYIQCEQERCYRDYVEDNLGTVLACDESSLEERARILHDTSVDIVRTAFEQRLPQALAQQQNFQRIVGFVQEAMQFLSSRESFRTVAKLISHDYRTYSHCVHVFLYSAAILQTYEKDTETLLQAGIGAMLHDIGKTLISHDILSKTGALTLTERRIINTHPVKGVSLIAALPLSQTACNCVLLHHEKLDGSGYPSGIAGDNIPLPVRAVTIADVYDAMTTRRPYCSAMNPFQVLRIMRDEMFHEIDMDMFKRFVTILSGAQVV